MTAQSSPDWVSMVRAAQASAAPAVVTADLKWSGEELLRYAAGLNAELAAGKRRFDFVNHASSGWPIGL